jgi:hypothetical protein
MTVNDIKVDAALSGSLDPSLTVRLPEQADLFVPSALHQLFERVDLAGDKPVERSWLYVPANILSQVTEPIGPRMNTASIRIARPIDAEEYQLHPLVDATRLIGLLAFPSERAELPTLDNLADCARLIGRRGYDDIEPEVVADFAGELFQRDDGAEQFLKRLLSMLVGYWPRSSAGLYVETQGEYQLRLVVGDVMRCHALPSHLSQEMTFRFLEALTQRENLVPAEMLQHSPTFLNLAPDFFFVHQGMRSERTNQLLVIAGPGEVSVDGVRRVRLAARLLSRLEESQFVTTHGLVDLYARIGARGKGSVSIDAEIRDLFELAAKQVSVSRMIVTRYGATDRTANNWIVSGHPTPRVRSSEAEASLIPEPTRQSLAKGECYHIADITRGGLTDAEAKQRYLENVHSEIYLPIRQQQRIVGVLVIGSPIAGSYLTMFPTLFEAAAAYAASVMAIENLSDQRVIPAGTAIVADRASSRLITVRKLIDGFLHGVSSRVSVVVGQTEMLAALFGELRTEGKTERAQIEKISTAGNELTVQVISLRTIISLLENGDDGSLDGALFLKDLANMFEGFARKIKDTKNVEISISYTASARQAYRLRTSDGIDFVIPLVVAIMEQAICSGTVSVQGNAKGSVPIISLQFRRNILGYTTISNLITKLFPELEPSSSASGEEQFQSNEHTVTCRLINDETYHVTLACRGVNSGEGGTTTIPGNRDI